MKVLKKLLSLLCGLVVLILSTSDASNTTSLEIGGGFSSFDILQSRYEILKLRMEITEKFGRYEPEFDQKLKALEDKFERLYKSLEYCRGVNVTHDTVQNIAATAVNVYLTDFNEMEEPKVCKVDANGNPVCNNLVLPTSCAEQNVVTCSQNKCHIQVKGFKSFVVTCNEDWIVIQRRVNGSVDFNRGWSDYKNGFGDLDGEFWLGLDKIHALTTELAPAELLINMRDFNGNEGYAKYKSFAICGEDEQYKLATLDRYSGNHGDSLALHQNETFSTYDADNDKNDNVNCAQSLMGGWWFFDCDERRLNSNLNGQYYERDDASHIKEKNGIKWSSFRGNDYSLKFVEMMIRRKA